MKKLTLRAVTLLLLLLCLILPAHANMAAPTEPDVGSSITFEQNDAIAVLSEVLDITVHGAEADIVATYRMKNTTGTAVTTPSMFLSPNVETGGVRVTANGLPVDFTVSRYALTWDRNIETDDWRFAVLTDPGAASLDESRSVDAISFELTFSPGEEYDVVVGYTYRLGGYPTYDFNAKDGIIEYYLSPAAMWKGFEDLTINLYLDEDMPVIRSSSLPFEKIDKRTYQYRSDTLPEGDLSIGIDENWFQNIFSTLRSPYLGMTLMLIAPVILVVAAAIIIPIVVWRVKKKRRGQG